MSGVLYPACEVEQKDDLKPSADTEYFLRLNPPLVEPLTSDLGIIITDRHAKIKYVNRAFSNITGYSLRDVRGKNPSILQSGYYGTSFYREMWLTIDHSGEWKGEILDRRKDGKIYWESLHIMRMKNDKDEVTGYIGIIYDKTECIARDLQQKYISELQEQLYGLMLIKGIVDKEVHSLMQKLDKVMVENKTSWYPRSNDP